MLRLCIFDLRRLKSLYAALPLVYGRADTMCRERTLRGASYADGKILKLPTALSRMLGPYMTTQAESLI